MCLCVHSFAEHPDRIVDEGFSWVLWNVSKKKIKRIVHSAKADFIFQFFVSISCFDFWVSERFVSLKYRNDQISPRKTAKRLGS